MRRRRPLTPRRGPHLLSGALAAVLAAGGVLAGCGADVDSQGATPGGRLYLQQCATCHGVGREGVGTAPALPVDRMVALGRPALRRTIAEGGTTMPGFAGVLSPSEIDLLVQDLVAPEG
jgi:mono/diheme cytochrome c family protein